MTTAHSKITDLGLFQSSDYYLYEAWLNQDHPGMVFYTTAYGTPRAWGDAEGQVFSNTKEVFLANFYEVSK